MTAPRALCPWGFTSVCRKHTDLMCSHIRECLDCCALSLGPVPPSSLRKAREGIPVVVGGGGSTSSFPAHFSTLTGVSPPPKCVHVSITVFLLPPNSECHLRKYYLESQLKLIQSFSTQNQSLGAPAIVQ